MTKAMNQTMSNINTATNNNKKEDKTMKKERIGVLGNIFVAAVLGSSQGLGYGIGYAKETIQDEACYYGNKIKNAVADTKIAQNFVDGYYAGTADAFCAYYERCNKREQKDEQKRINKAAQEMIDDLENQ